jgi:hypothetical protein
MKFIIIIILSLISFNSFAKCLSKAPISAVRTYIESTVPVAGVDCSERPDEECICFDGIESWKVVDLEDEMVNGEAKYSAKINVTDCETPEACDQIGLTLCEAPYEYKHAKNIILPGYEAYCTKITGYEKVKSGRKILKENAAKKVAHLAMIEAKRLEREKEQAKEAKIQAKIREMAEKELAREAK